ncbi:MAG: hypothetical protein QHH30_01620 [candidate division NC10 bacterium]|nr:hypothetical protein [candidate division NC10 bacterium]
MGERRSLHGKKREAGFPRDPASCVVRGIKKRRIVGDLRDGEECVWHPGEAGPATGTIIYAWALASIWN